MIIINIIKKNFLSFAILAKELCYSLTKENRATVFVKELKNSLKKLCLILDNNKTTSEFNILQEALKEITKSQYLIEIMTYTEYIDKNNGLLLLSKANNLSQSINDYLYPVKKSATNWGSAQLCSAQCTVFYEIPAEFLRL